ncbi:MAG: hypothetical protein GX811_12045, partial [Lentisphaerae bacterium]|nr:hypothetical protein [Lentisphaerota bacterium]
MSRVTSIASEQDEENKPRVLPTRPPTNSTSIGAIKFLPDGAEVSISQKIVTYVQEDKLYVQEMDRSSAIRAASPGFPIMVSPGDVVSFSGTLRTVDMEREILFDGSIVVHISDVPLPDALGMNEKFIVGGPLNAFTPGIPDCPGINTVGLRAQIWGRATSELFVDETGDWCFYFDDGSNIQDGTLRGYPSQKTKGVRVYSYMPPTVGDFKIVRGVCGITLRQPVSPETERQPVRVIRTGSHYDIFDPGTVGPPIETDQITGTVRLVGAVNPQKARVYSTKT